MLVPLASSPQDLLPLRSKVVGKRTTTHIANLLGIRHAIQLIVRILIPDITHKTVAATVPTLEVAACETEHSFRGPVAGAEDIFFGDVADGFIADTIVYGQ
jgi:hypothetical protein